MVVSLTDQLSNGAYAQISGDVDCNLEYDEELEAYLLIVPAGGTATCPYSVEGPHHHVTVSSNTATATLNGIPFSATEDIHWTPTVINPVVQLDDDQNPSWPTNVSSDSYFEYPGKYTCPSDPAAYYDEDGVFIGLFTSSVRNRAMIKTLAGMELSRYYAEVYVNCYAPVVSKEPAAAYDERHEWDVEKTGHSAHAGHLGGQDGHP